MYGASRARARIHTTPHLGDDGNSSTYTREQSVRAASGRNPLAPVVVRFTVLVRSLPQSVRPSACAIISVYTHPRYWRTRVTRTHAFIGGEGGKHTHNIYARGRSRFVYINCCSVVPPPLPTRSVYNYLLASPPKQAAVVVLCTGSRPSVVVDEIFRRTLTAVHCPRPDPFLPAAPRASCSTTMCAAVPSNSCRSRRRWSYEIVFRTQYVGPTYTAGSWAAFDNVFLSKRLCLVKRALAHDVNVLPTKRVFAERIGFAYTVIATASNIIVHITRNLHYTNRQTEFSDPQNRSQ